MSLPRAGSSELTGEIREAAAGRGPGGRRDRRGDGRAGPDRRDRTSGTTATGFDGSKHQGPAGPRSGPVRSCLRCIGRTRTSRPAKLSANYSYMAGGPTTASDISDSGRKARTRRRPAPAHHAGHVQGSTAASRADGTSDPPVGFCRNQVENFLIIESS